jgi:hypothetical protein
MVSGDHIIPGVAINFLLRIGFINLGNLTVFLYIKDIYRKMV